MKLLIVTSFFPTSSKDKVPQFLYQQVCAFAKYNPHMNILVLTTSRSENDDTEIPQNVTIKRFSYFFPRSKQNLTNFGIMPAIKNNKFNILQVPLLFIFEFIAIIKTILIFKPDYLYSHWFLPQGILCHIASKIFRIPHLFTSHSYDVEVCKKIPIIGIRMVRTAIRNMKSISVVSNRTLSGVAHFFNPTEWKEIKLKCKIIPMGISKPNSKDYNLTVKNSKFHKLKDKTVFLFMGRFVEKKGIDLLLQSFSRLLLDNKNIVLILAGNGIKKKHICELISKLKLDEYVYMPGFITTEEKNNYLNLADAFVLPSIDTQEGDREGLPVSLLESMSYGKVCIATDGSGADEVIVHGVNGFLCKSGNVTSLYEAMHNFLCLNIPLSNAIKTQAASTAEKYYWDNIISRQVEHFFKPAVVDSKNNSSQ